MRKFLYVAATFVLCAVFGFAEIWTGFTAVYILFLFGKTESSALWEIPMAVLAGSIIIDFFPENADAVIKVLIPFGAVLTAYYLPAKLIIFFVAAIGALFIKNESGIAAMCAVIWCGGREFIIGRQKFLNYSSIKKRLLQGNSREKYVEFSENYDILENNGNI